MSARRGPPRSLDERFELWLVRSFVWTTRRQKRPAEPVPDLPGGARPRPVPIRLAMVAFAGITPVLCAVALIPLRSVIAAPTAALVMVLPVVGVALVVPRVASVVAAVSAALAFDVLLTEPYYSVAIDAATDVEAAVVLGLLGLLVTTVVSRELEARSRSQSRVQEITALTETARALNDPDLDRLVRVVTAQLTELLELRSCDWSPGFHGRVGHVLSRDGTIGEWAGPGLPDGVVEVPVHDGRTEVGRLLLRASDGHPVSREERSTVLAIADLLGAGLRT